MDPKTYKNTRDLDKHHLPKKTEKEWSWRIYTSAFKIYYKAYSN